MNPIEPVSNSHKQPETETMAKTVNEFMLPEECKTPLKDEVLLREDPQKYVIFPLTDQDIWKAYKQQEGCFWTAEEIDLSKDLEDWHKLTDKEQFFIKYVLAFFAGSDGIVGENLGVNFINEVGITEAKLAYGFQLMMEGIHSEVYSLLIDTYVRDPDEKTHLFEAIHTIPCIAEKAKWSKRWINDPDANFATRLVAFACVEGIFFSGSFCAIYWLKKRGLMPGLTFSNELISRDEGLHTDFAVLLYKKLTFKLSQQTIETIINNAVEIECNFITESIPCNMIGMNSTLMKQYIQFVADRLMMQLGYDKIYHVECPFEFMNLISLDGKTNFFERRVGEYSKSGFSNSIEGKQKMTIDNAFDDDDF